MKRFVGAQNTDPDLPIYLQENAPENAICHIPLQVLRESMVPDLQRGENDERPVALGSEDGHTAVDAGASITTITASTTSTTRTTIGIIAIMDVLRQVPGGGGRGATSVSHRSHQTYLA